MSGPPDGAEDRRAPGDAGRRFGVNWDLTAGHRELRSIRGRVLNVSLTGILIRVPAPYAVGNIVEIEMSPAVGVSVRTVVQIVRLHAQGEHHFDYGAVIIRHTDETRLFFTQALLELRRQEMRSDFGREPPLPRERKKPPT